MRVTEPQSESAARDRRIDVAHATAKQVALATPARGSNVLPGSSDQDVWGDSEEADHDLQGRLLRLHSTGLITELQRWSRELEARESQLNTRDALLDQRIRQFRTWEKSQKQELDEARRELSKLENDARSRLRLAAAAEYC